MIRRAVPLLLTFFAAACTGGAPAADPPSPTVYRPECPSFAEGRVGPDCDLTVQVRGATYGLACVPVPSFLLDVPLAARWGGAKVRSIAAVAVEHAVAVLADDATGECGEWTIATREGLEDELLEDLAQELRDAATLPPDPEGDPAQGE